MKLSEVVVHFVLMQTLLVFVCKRDPRSMATRWLSHTIEVRFISNLTPGSHSPKGQVRLNWCLIQDLRDWKKNLLIAMGRSTQNREICDFKSFKGRPQWNIEGPVRSDNPSKKVVIFTTKFLINRNHVGRVTVRIIETSGRHLLFSRSKNKRKQKTKTKKTTANR